MEICHGVYSLVYYPDPADGLGELGSTEVARRVYAIGMREHEGFNLNADG